MNAYDYIGLGLGLINHSQKATMEAKKTAAIKV